MSTILTFDFQKRKQLHFSEKKLTKLHKKDTTLHVTITIFLKQGQTRASSGLITLPLIVLLLFLSTKSTSTYLFIC